MTSSADPSRKDLSDLLILLTGHELFGLGIEDRQCPFTSPASWRAFREMACRQRVEAVLWDAMNSLGWIPESVPDGGTVCGMDWQEKLKWALSVEKVEKSYSHITKVAGAVTSTVKGAGYRFRLLKGLTLASIYPVPEHRMFGDVDIYLPDRPLEVEALLSSKFKVEVRRGLNHHDKMMLAGTEVELHRFFFNQSKYSSNRRLQVILDELFNSGDAGAGSGGAAVSAGAGSGGAAVSAGVLAGSVVSGGACAAGAAAGGSGAASAAGSCGVLAGSVVSGGAGAAGAAGGLGSAGAAAGGSGAASAAGSCGVLAGSVVSGGAGAAGAAGGLGSAGAAAGGFSGKRTAELLFLLRHAGAHLVNAELSVLNITDIGRHVLAYSSEIDFARVRSVALECGFCGWYEVVMALLSDRFGLQLPSTGALDTAGDGAASTPASAPVPASVPAPVPASAFASASASASSSDTLRSLVGGWNVDSALLDKVLDSIFNPAYTSEQKAGRSVLKLTDWFVSNRWKQKLVFRKDAPAAVYLRTVLLWLKRHL